MPLKNGRKKLSQDCSELNVLLLLLLLILCPSIAYLPTYDCEVNNRLDNSVLESCAQADTRYLVDGGQSTHQITVHPILRSYAIFIVDQ